MKKFIALYAAVMASIFFLLGCATSNQSQSQGRSQTEEGGYTDKFEETQLTPSSMPAQEEAPWEAE